MKTKQYKVLLLTCFLGALATLFSGCKPKTAQATNGNEVKHQQESKPTVALLFFNQADRPRQAYIAKEISQFYGCKTVILPPIHLPKSAYYPPRNRYRADSLIAFLKRYKPAAYDKIIGFANKDISVTKGSATDWGVFGLGFRPGPSCVVSSYRLSRNKPSQQLLADRMSKVALHELGHTLGVPHCTSGDQRCFMRDAKGKLSTVDETRKHMCTKCRTTAKF